MARVENVDLGRGSDGPSNRMRAIVDSVFGVRNCQRMRRSRQRARRAIAGWICAVTVEYPGKRTDTGIRSVEPPITNRGFSPCNASLKAFFPRSASSTMATCCCGAPCPWTSVHRSVPFIDHYRHQSRRGIGDSPHPHAGIEAISYLLEGGVAHRDSLGFKDTLGPGDAQWIRAGRGMWHAEQPSGGRHGLQLWTSLPPAQKLAEPAYASFRAAGIPEIRHAGARVRVIAGSLDRVQFSEKLQHHGRVAAACALRAWQVRVVASRNGIAGQIASGFSIKRSFYPIGMGATSY